MAKPWTAPDNAPAWARGKSPEEILGLSTQMYATLEQINARQQPVAPVQVAPVQAPANFNDDDFVSGAQVRELLRQATGQVQPQMQSTVDALANLSLGYVKDRNKEAFDRYGPEIHAFVANMAKKDQTVDNLTGVVNFVRSNHLDELVAEKVRQNVAEQLPTMRSNGGAGTGASIPNAGRGLQSDTLPESFRRKADSVGISESDLDDFCRVNGMSRDQFFKQFDGKQFMTAAVAENRIHTGPR